jgi:hypothetical protein
MVDKMHFLERCVLHTLARQPRASEVSRPDWKCRNHHVEQKRRTPKRTIGPTKRAATKVEDLAKLLSELRRLRERVQRAEAVRGFR